MTLEDRIRNTGEHLLGSLETRPDLPDRIQQRVEHRTHQRRQRAAAGLGAGVVVVLGGLVVLNVTSRSPGGSTTATGGAPQSISTLMATTTLAIAPEPTPAASTTTTVVASSQPVTTADSAVEVASTVVAPMGAGAPALYTADDTAARLTAIHLDSGRASEQAPQATTSATTAPGTPTSGATFALADVAAADHDRCDQRPVVATDASGAPIPDFPTAALSLTLSRDGSTGVIRSGECPEPGTIGVDGPTGQPFSVRSAWFRTDDPSATLHPLDLEAIELSDDGRFVVLEQDGAPVAVLDTTDESRSSLLPDGCGSAQPDPDAGFLLGADGVAAVAQCDGRMALVGGRVGETAVVQHLDNCGAEAALAVFDPAQATVEQNWFAVTDTQARIAWVVTSNTVSGPIPVGDRVAWHPLGIG